MWIRASLIPIMLAASACGGATPVAPAPSAPTNKAAEAAPADSDDGLVVTPEKTGPEAPTGAEKAELSGVCSPLLLAMVEGETAALTALDAALRDSTPDAEEVALKVALDRVKKSREGLTEAEYERCLALFEKQQRRKQFEHDPSEGEARMVVDSCIKRVEAVYGKQTMSFDEGNVGVRQGPFCPDEFPVPQKLSELPYQSTKDDWESPAFRCLQFGLRMKQHIQFEYSSPMGSGEFRCIARYLPRQGGAPIEVVRGGKQGPEGRLLLEPKTTLRRMTPKH